MSGDHSDRRERVAFASAVRDACIDRLRHDYEQAAIQGLCGEGAFEYALDRLRHVPAAELLAARRSGANPPFNEGTDS